MAEKVPVRAARALFPKVVAADVSNPPPKEPPRTALEAALLAGEASRRLKELALKEADLVIALDPPFPIYTFDHGKISLVYQLGQRRAWERLQEVQALAQVRLKDLLPAFLKAGPPPAKGG